MGEEKANDAAGLLDLTRPVLNHEEAARYLGIGRNALLKIAQDAEGKTFGHARVGARLAFLHEDLDRYVCAEEPRTGASIGWKINPKRVTARDAAKQ